MLLSVPMKCPGVEDYFIDKYLHLMGDIRFYDVIIINIKCESSVYSRLKSSSGLVIVLPSHK